jgi:hypothetical protein
VSRIRQTTDGNNFYNYLHDVDRMSLYDLSHRFGRHSEMRKHISAITENKRLIDRHRREASVSSNPSISRRLQNVKLIRNQMKRTAKKIRLKSVASNGRLPSPIRRLASRLTRQNVFGSGKRKKKTRHTRRDYTRKNNKHRNKRHRNKRR